MYIGHHILDSKALPYLRELRCDQLLFVLDAGAEAALPSAFASFVREHVHLSLGINSEDKGTQLLAELWTWLSSEGASRESVLVIVGGGTLSDAAGFAAASYMRGIRTVYISTTLLAMVDASVGGKTAIDFAGVKNLIGAFHEPEEIFIDTCFLDTLPVDELFSGYGEVLKTALLSGEGLWRRVLSLGDPQQYSGTDWLEVITACVDYKASVVAQDPEERSGLRAILNLGHTTAHALESHSRAQEGRRALLHGEAVVIGLIVESYLAYRHLGLDRAVLKQLMYHCQELYPQYQYTCSAYPDLLRLMRSDKKNSHGQTHFVLLRTLSKAERWVAPSDADIEEALDFYREAFGG